MLESLAEIMPSVSALTLATIFLVLAVALLLIEVCTVASGVLLIASAGAGIAAIVVAFLAGPATGLVFLIGAPLLLIGISIWGFRRLQKSRLVAQEEITAQAGYSAQAQAHGILIGSVGVMLTDAMPSGRARFDEHEYDVAATSGFLSRGQTVRVVALEGAEILVQPERSTLSPK